jgi:hypothetical protein
LEKRMAAMENEMHELALANQRLVQLLAEKRPAAPPPEPTSPSP